MVALVAAVACVTVNSLQHSASSALWLIYSVDPGSTLTSPDGHWQARLLDESAGLAPDDEWNKVQVRPTGTSGWREVGRYLRLGCDHALACRWPRAHRR